MTTIPASVVPVTPAPPLPAEQAPDAVELSEIAATFAALLAGLAPLPVPTVPAPDGAVPSASGIDAPAAATAVPVAIPAESFVPPVLPLATPAATAELVVAVAPELGLDDDAEITPAVAPPATEGDAAPASVSAVPTSELDAMQVSVLATPEVDDAPAEAPTDATRPREPRPEQPAPADDLAPVVPVLAAAATAFAAEPSATTDPAAPVQDREPAPVGMVTVAQAGRPAPVAPAPAAEAPRPAPPAPHTQVVRVVTPLVQQGEGEYRVGIQLTPEHLGRVQVDVQVIDGHVNVNLRADQQTSNETLRAAIPQLRSELEAAGIRPGRIDVGGQAGWQAPSQQQSHQQSSHQAQPFSLFEANRAGSDAETTIRPTTQGATDGSLDVLV